MNTAAEDLSCVVPFQFESKQIRVIQKPDGSTWFIANDVCLALSFEHPSSNLRRLDEDEKGVHSMHTHGGLQDLSIINESGLYSLILTSRKPEAKKFKKWVTSEVLPAIRKTGCYAVPGAQIREDLSASQKALWDHVIEWMSRRREPFTMADVRKEIPISKRYLSRLIDAMLLHRLLVRESHGARRFSLSDKARLLFGLWETAELPGSAPSADTVTITRKEWSDLSSRIHDMAERLKSPPPSPPPLKPIQGHWRLKEEAAANYRHIQEQFDRVSNRMLHFFPAEALAEALDIPYRALIEFLSEENFEIVSEYALDPHPPRPAYIQKHQPILYVTTFGLWKIMGAGRSPSPSAASVPAAAGEAHAQPTNAREVPKGEQGVPITDFGTFNMRPWETAKRMYPELHAALEAKYAELGKEKHRGWESLKDSVFWLTEQFAVYEEYRQAMAPRYLEAVLKLQLMALGHASVLEEMGKLYDLKKLPKVES